MNKDEIRQAIKDLAQRISNDVANIDDLVIVGIHTGGVHLARRIQKEIADKRGKMLPCGTLDITLYRDDLFEGLPKPIVGATDLPASVEGKEVVLVDDVLYTGRTVRSALVELMDYGRPKRIRFAALVDRGHRELPICADYIARVIEASKNETVEVNLEETGLKEEVVVARRGE